MRSSSWIPGTELLNLSESLAKRESFICSQGTSGLWVPRQLPGKDCSTERPSHDQKVGDFSPTPDLGGGKRDTDGLQSPMVNELVN